MCEYLFSVATMKITKLETKTLQFEQPVATRECF